MELKIPMGPFDPDVENFYSRDVLLSMEYDDNGYMYSYLRYIAAAESGLLPIIKNDPNYDFEEHYLDAIRYRLDISNPSICFMKCALIVGKMKSRL